MSIDAKAERERMQAMLTTPQDDFELAIKRDILSNGSEPREWSDETVEAAHYMLRIYAMGWRAAKEPQ